jgi:hypothetical protein
MEIVQLSAKPFGLFANKSGTMPGIHCGSDYELAQEKITLLLKTSSPTSEPTEPEPDATRSLLSQPVRKWDDLGC